MIYSKEEKIKYRKERINDRIERAKELTKEKNMRGRTLTNCLVDIAYYDAPFFTYPISLDEFSNFVQSWIDQNKGIWVFDRYSTSEFGIKTEFTEKQKNAKTLRKFLEMICDNTTNELGITRFNFNENDLARRIRYKISLFKKRDLHKEENYIL